MMTDYNEKYALIWWKGADYLANLVWCCLQYTFAFSITSSCFIIFNEEGKRAESQEGGGGGKDRAQIQEEVEWVV